MFNSSKTLSFAALVALLLVGCAEVDTNERVLTANDVGSDAAGEADGKSDGWSPDLDVEDVGTDDVGQAGDTETDASDPNPALCSPNRDGVITRQEVPLRAGLSARFKVATGATVSTAGAMEDGGRVWDLASDLAGDRLELVELQSMDGRWFLPDFPEADYASRLSARSELLGLFQITDEALLLVGVVSPEGGMSRTNVSYSPPVKVLEFPMQEGATWTTDSTVRGVAQGIGVYYSEEYTSTVDKTGELRTPFGDFPVLRIRTEMERVVGFLTTNVRSYFFVSECFGTVATIVSEDNEAEIEFTTAAEVRRLTP